jgi:hypothetical protein
MHPGHGLIEYRDIRHCVIGARAEGKVELLSILAPATQLLLVQMSASAG